jgi:hypothetical protein
MVAAEAPKPVNSANHEISAATEERFNIENPGFP